MSDRPLIIKSKFFNIRPEKMEEVRKIIKKQMEEATPVVMLPCGFELAEVNEEMLESIKAEIESIRDVEVTDGCIYVSLDDVNEILDKRISELKGEQE